MKFNEDHLRTLIDSKSRNSFKFTKLIEDELKNSEQRIRNIIGCAGFPIEVQPDKYFLAQEFNETKDDLRRALEQAIKNISPQIRSVRGDDKIHKGSIFCKVLADILGTRFGIYQLTESQNRNVYLELGIAISTGKNFILVKDFGAQVASLVSDLDRFEIKSYEETRREFGISIKEMLEGFSKRNHSIINDYGFKLQEKNQIFFSHGDLEIVDTTFRVSRAISKHNLNIEILGNDHDKLKSYIDELGIKSNFINSRFELINSLLKSKFGIFRADKNASPNTFFALGLAIGLGIPFYLITNTRNSDLDRTITDLLQFGSLEFEGVCTLENKLTERLPSWVKAIDLENSQSN